MLWKATVTYETRGEEGGARQRVTAVTVADNRDDAIARVQEQIRALSRAEVHRWVHHSVYAVPNGVEFLGRLPA